MKTKPATVKIRQTWDIQHATALASLDGASIAQPISSPLKPSRQIPQPDRDTVGQAPSSLQLPSELSVLLSGPSPIPLLIASVVPDQTRYWQTAYPSSRVLTLENIPLIKLYPTLGIDRALAILGAWHEWRTSALVIDGGTALTLTGVDSGGTLIGGAILPGLGLQMRSLHQQTAALPSVRLKASALDTPQTLGRWQTNTPDAIRSGIWYGAIAGVQSFINDWLAQYPNSAIIFTGGDGEMLCGAISQAMAKPNSSKASATNIVYDPQIIFKGIAFAEGTEQPPSLHHNSAAPQKTDPSL